MQKILLILIILIIGITAFADDMFYVTMPSTYTPDPATQPEYVRVSFDAGAGISTSTKDDPMKVKPVFELDITTKFKNGLGFRPVLHFDIEATDAVHLNLSLGARYYWQRVVVGLTLGMDNFQYFDASAHVRYRFPVGQVEYETLFVHVEGLVHYTFTADNLRFGLLGGIEF